MSARKDWQGWFPIPSLSLFHSCNAVRPLEYDRRDNRWLGMSHFRRLPDLLWPAGHVDRVPVLFRVRGAILKGCWHGGQSATVAEGCVVLRVRSDCEFNYWEGWNNPSLPLHLLESLLFQSSSAFPWPVCSRACCCSEPVPFTEWWDSERSMWWYWHIWCHSIVFRLYCNHSVCESYGTYLEPPALGPYNSVYGDVKWEFMNLI